MDSNPIDFSSTPDLPQSSVTGIVNQGDQRFERIISEVEDYAIIVLDVNGIVKSWNKGAELIKGYSAGQIIGTSFKIFYLSDDIQAGLPDTLLLQAKMRGRTRHEGWRVRKDGTRFWGSVTITALHDDAGEITSYLKLTRDLTDRKVADDRYADMLEELRLKNEELRRSEERYHKMISEVKDYAILLLDKSGNILNWNAGAELIKGYSAQEIVGKNFFVFYTPEDIKQGIPSKLINEAELAGRASTEGWRKRKDGTLFWGSVVITALHDDSGALIGFSKVTRDLTDRKIAEDILRKNSREMEVKNAELGRLNTELTSFAYVVSHDLKEPVRKIQVFANRQLEPGKTDEQTKEFTNKIIHTASRMQMMMESLLTYATISNDYSKRENVDLNKILMGVESDLEVSIVESSASIQSENLPVINGIPFQLHQLFLNILSNALKFRRHDRPLQILITSKIEFSSVIPGDFRLIEKNYHHITISDNGIGFDKTQTSQIFDVFRRLQNNNSPKGAGVGLAIVKKVVENHNGFIKAEGETGKGAVFNIYLPSEK